MKQEQIYNIKSNLLRVGKVMAASIFVGMFALGVSSTAYGEFVPPGGLGMTSNPMPPINTSGFPQTKAGNLTVLGLDVANNMLAGEIEVGGAFTTNAEVDPVTSPLNVISADGHIGAVKFCSLDGDNCWTPGSGVDPGEGGQLPAWTVNDAGFVLHVVDGDTLDWVSILNSLPSADEEQIIQYNNGSWKIVDPDFGNGDVPSDGLWMLSADFVELSSEIDANGVRVPQLTVDGGVLNVGGEIITDGYITSGPRLVMTPDDSDVTWITQEESEPNTGTGIRMVGGDNGDSKMRNSVSFSAGDVAGDGKEWIAHFYPRTTNGYNTIFNTLYLPEKLAVGGEGGSRVNDMNSTLDVAGEVSADELFSIGDISTFSHFRGEKLVIQDGPAEWGLDNTAIDPEIYVDGPVKAVEYCNLDGTQCFSAADVSPGGNSSESWYVNQEDTVQVLSPNGALPIDVLTVRSGEYCDGDGDNCFSATDVGSGPGEGGLWETVDGGISYGDATIYSGHTEVSKLKVTDNLTGSVSSMSYCDQNGVNCFNSQYVPNPPGSKGQYTSDDEGDVLLATVVENGALEWQVKQTGSGATIWQQEEDTFNINYQAGNVGIGGPSRSDFGLFVDNKVKVDGDVNLARLVLEEDGEGSSWITQNPDSAEYTDGRKASVGTSIGLFESREFEGGVAPSGEIHFRGYNSINGKYEEIARIRNDVSTFNSVLWAPTFSTRSLTLTQGSGPGKILQSDDDGNATWVEPSEVGLESSESLWQSNHNPSLEIDPFVYTGENVNVGIGVQPFDAFSSSYESGGSVLEVNGVVVADSLFSGSIKADEVTIENTDTDSDEGYTALNLVSGTAHGNIAVAGNDFTYPNRSNEYAGDLFLTSEGSINFIAGCTVGSESGDRCTAIDNNKMRLDVNGDTADLHVSGEVRAQDYCDEDGGNCLSSLVEGSGGSTYWVEDDVDDEGGIIANTKIQATRLTLEESGGSNAAWITLNEKKANESPLAIGLEGDTTNNPYSLTIGSWDKGDKLIARFTHKDEGNSIINNDLEVKGNLTVDSINDSGTDQILTTGIRGDLKWLKKSDLDVGLPDSTTDSAGSFLVSAGGGWVHTDGLSVRSGSYRDSETGETRQVSVLDSVYAIIGQVDSSNYCTTIERNDGSGNSVVRCFDAGDIYDLENNVDNLENNVDNWSNEIVNIGDTADDLDGRVTDLEQDSGSSGGSEDLFTYHICRYEVDDGSYTVKPTNDGPDGGTDPVCLNVDLDTNFNMDQVKMTCPSINGVNYEAISGGVICEQSNKVEKNGINYDSTKQWITNCEGAMESTHVVCVPSNH